VAIIYIIVSLTSSDLTPYTAFITHVQTLGGASSSGAKGTTKAEPLDSTHSIDETIPKSASGLPLANYAIVIDAGSSGSRLYVYQYKLPELLSIKNGKDRLGNPSRPPTDPTADLLHVALAVDSQGRPVIKKHETGLSAYADHPGEVFSAIKPLLDFARSHIPPQLYSRTPIYVLATAGLRLIPVEKKDAILATLRMHLKLESDAGGFLFEKDDHATVITGEQEGLYGWIALNYVLNRFGDLNSTYASGGLDPHTYTILPPKPAHPWYSPLPQSPAELTPPRTVGLVELGGGSAQIAFEADDELEDPDQGPVSHPEEFVFHLDLDLTRCGPAVEKYSKSEYYKRRRGATASAQEGRAAEVSAAVTPGSESKALTKVPPSRVRIEQQRGKGLGVGGHVYNIYSASFLGYGANSARSRYVQTLIETRQRLLENNLYNGPPGMDKVILDGCLLKHQRQIVSLKNTWGKSLPPAKKGSPTPAPDATTIHLEPGEFLLEGSGQFDECRKGLVAILDKELPCPYRCPFGGKYQPVLSRQILSQQFYAFSEYWYTTRDVLGLDPGSFTSEKFLQVSHELCSAEQSDFHDVYENFKKGKYAANANEDRIRQQCFKSAWLDAILFQGHEFPRDLSPASILPISSIEGTEIQWTLGALIALTTEKLKRDPALCRRMATQDGLSDVRLKIASEMLNQKDGIDANAALPPTLVDPSHGDTSGSSGSGAPKPDLNSARYAKRGYAPEGTSQVYTEAQMKSLEMALNERRKGLIKRLIEFMASLVTPSDTTSAPTSTVSGKQPAVVAKPAGSTVTNDGYVVVLNGGETVSVWLWVIVLGLVIVAARLSYLLASGPLDTLSMSTAASRLLGGSGQLPPRSSSSSDAVPLYTRTSRSLLATPDPALYSTADQSTSLI